MAKNHAAKNRGNPKKKYNMAYACFTCCKAFKHPYVEGKWNGICAECKSETFNMGRKFRSPAKDEKGKWKVIEYIRRLGKWGNFSSADGKTLPFPKTLRDAKDFVEKIEMEKAKGEMTARKLELQIERQRKARKKRAEVRRKMAELGKLK